MGIRMNSLEDECECAFLLPPSPALRLLALDSSSGGGRGSRRAPGRFVHGIRIRVQLQLAHWFLEDYDTFCWVMLVKSVQIVISCFLFSFPLQTRRWAFSFCQSKKNAAVRAIQLFSRASVGERGGVVGR